MSKNRASTRLKPTPDVPRKRNDHTLNTLEILKSKSESHKRRIDEAKFCIGQGIYPTEARDALREIVARPDGSVRGKKALDIARRMLMRLDKRKVRRPMILPESWKGLIGGIANRLVEWMPDREFVHLSTKERFPDFNPADYPRDREVDDTEGDSDDEG